MADLNGDQIKDLVVADQGGSVVAVISTKMTYLIWRSVTGRPMRTGKGRGSCWVWVAESLVRSPCTTLGEGRPISRSETLTGMV